jgi:tRNA pseudouridine38-40 synthase
VTEQGLSVLLGQPVRLTGCGRTDTGVHAREFWAHFEVTRVDHLIVNALISRMNHLLPNDIVVYDMFPVHSDAHARFSALSRTYSYHISRVKDPFDLPYSWYQYGKQNVGLMNEGARLIMEYRDFTSFSKLHTQVNNNLCTILQARWEEKDDKLVFTITADRFLRNMVRAIVGTLMDLGRGFITLDELRKIIESRNRSEAGMSVPACGLFLEKVEYPEDVFLLKRANVSF